MVTGKSLLHTENGRQRPAKAQASLVAEGLLCVHLTLCSQMYGWLILIPSPWLGEGLVTRFW